jgi:hypothetical protein
VEDRHRAQFEAAAFASGLLNLFDGLLFTVEQVYLIVFEETDCKQAGSVLEKSAHIFVFEVYFFE